MMLSRSAGLGYFRHTNLPHINTSKSKRFSGAKVNKYSDWRTGWTTDDLGFDS